MAVGLPLKTTYANGDVYSASDVNDTNGTINAYLAPSLGYAAGKNAIINGDFYINQRGFTSTTTNSVYTFDRWSTDFSGGTVTYSSQTFTPGTAPVSGYEGKTFLQIVTSGQSGVNDYADIFQRIEEVRTFAGQTVTVSFWAKASSGTPKMAVAFRQYFGAGGSSDVSTNGGTVTLSTSWARYTTTVTIPSLTGKTLGTNSYLNLWLLVSSGSGIGVGQSIGVQNNTFQIWGVQVEEGSTATAFQTATGTIQGELAACQRYCYAITAGSNFPARAFNANFLYQGGIPFPVTMRTAPTLRSGGTFSVNTGSAGTMALDGSATTSGNIYNSAANWTTNAAVNYSATFEAEL